MGYYTPVLISNDRLADIEADPQRFVDQLRPVICGGPIEGHYVTGATVLSPEHADTFRLLAVDGGMLVELDHGASETRRLLNGKPFQRDIVLRLLNKAEARIARMRAQIEESEGTG